VSSGSPIISGVHHLPNLCNVEHDCNVNNLKSGYCYLSKIQIRCVMSPEAFHWLCCPLNKAQISQKTLYDPISTDLISHHSSSPSLSTICQCAPERAFPFAVPCACSALESLRPTHSLGEWHPSACYIIHILIIILIKVQKIFFLMCLPSPLDYKLCGGRNDVLLIFQVHNRYFQNACSMH
jgi:hypothetical protein